MSARPMGRELVGQQIRELGFRGLVGVADQLHCGFVVLREPAFGFGVPLKPSVFGNLALLEMRDQFIAPTLGIKRQQHANDFNKTRLLSEEMCCRPNTRSGTSELASLELHTKQIRCMASGIRSDRRRLSATARGAGPHKPAGNSESRLPTTRTNPRATRLSVGFQTNGYGNTEEKSSCTLKRSTDSDVVQFL